MTLANRYPDADILAQRAHWDDATRAVVLDRVHNVPPFRYYDVEYRRRLEALCARIIPQDHRPPERRVPIAPWIDARCDRRVVDGVRFRDMPPNEVAWTWGLDGVDQTAQALFGERFTELDGHQQDQVLRAIAGGDPPGEVWQRMPARRWWIHTAVRQISGAYYAHPYAWDEIGFGGPAYPRGYASLNFGMPEPWEPREVPTERPEPAAALPTAPTPAAPTREPRWPAGAEPALATPRWRSRTRPGTEPTYEDQREAER